MEEELEGWEATDAPLDGYASEGELDTRKLIAKQNKKKKSGGFQVVFNVKYVTWVKSTSNDNIFTH